MAEYLSKYTGQEIEAAIEAAIEAPATYLTLKKWLDINFPVGGNERYVQFPNAPTPASKFAGTSWEIDTTLQGRTLIGSGGSYTFGSTGGSATHTNTINEMVAHEHDQRLNVANGNSIGALVYNSTGGTSTGVFMTGGDYTTTAKGRIRTYAEGSGQSYSILNPYTVVNYWKRTA